MFEVQNNVICIKEGLYYCFRLLLICMYRNDVCRPASATATRPSNNDFVNNLAANNRVKKIEKVLDSFPDMVDVKSTVSGM